MPAVYNGANEAAVGLFLKKEISFDCIAQRVERALEKAENHAITSFEELLEADRMAREAALKG